MTGGILLITSNPSLEIGGEGVFTLRLAKELSKRGWKIFAHALAILTVGALIVGVLLVIAAITLHGLKRINERLTKFHAVNQ